MADLGDLIATAPPVSRTLAGATIILSFSSIALGLFNPALLIYYPGYVWTLGQPQIWRLVTSFFLSGPGLGILLDPYFLFRYASDCERTRFSRPGDFIVFLVFCGVAILTLNTFVFSGMTFNRPLMLALAYYWTAFEPAASRVNFFIATFPVKFLPFVMLLMTFVQGGLAPTLVEATGLVAAHLYLFLTDIWPRLGGGVNPIFTPEWLNNWMSDRPEPVRAPPPRRASVPAVAVGGDETRATGSMFGGRGGQDAWSHRGQGHRLGS